MGFISNLDAPPAKMQKVVLTALQVHLNVKRFAKNILRKNTGGIVAATQSQAAATQARKKSFIRFQQMKATLASTGAPAGSNKQTLQSRLSGFPRRSMREEVSIPDNMIPDTDA